MIDLNEFNFNLSDNQKEKLKTYYQFLVEYNNSVNLTSITNEDDVYIKHFLDSMLGMRFIKENCSVIDIGSGAGFPGVVLKIMDSSLNLTLVDSLQKRVSFLKELCKKLEISAQCIHARAEDYILNNREKFDIAVSRAVANLTTLCEWCLPYVKVGGLFIAYKGANIDEEIAGAQDAIRILGGRIEKVEQFELPFFMGARNFVLIRKITATPKKFPRSKNMAKFKPLRKKI